LSRTFSPPFLPASRTVIDPLPSLSFSAIAPSSPSPLLATRALALVDQLAHLLPALAADLLVELVPALVAHCLAALAADLAVERRPVTLLGGLPALLAALAAGFADGHVAFRDPASGHRLLAPGASAPPSCPLRSGRA